MGRSLVSRVVRIETPSIRLWRPASGSFLGRYVKKKSKLSSSKAPNVLSCLLVQCTFDERSLLLLERQNTIFNGARNKDSVDPYRLLLADTVSAIDGLFFDKRIPERVQNYDCRRRRSQHSSMILSSYNSGYNVEKGKLRRIFTLRASNEIQARVSSLQRDKHDLAFFLLHEIGNGVIPGRS